MYVYVCVYMYMYMYVYVCVCMYMYMYVYVCVCMYMYMYVYGVLVTDKCKSKLSYYKTLIFKPDINRKEKWIPLSRLCQFQEFLFFRFWNNRQNVCVLKIPPIF